MGNRKCFSLFSPLSPSHCSHSRDNPLSVCWKHIPFLINFTVTFTESLRLAWILLLDPRTEVIFRNIFSSNSGLAHLLSWSRHHMVGIMDPRSRTHVYTGWRDQRGNFNLLSKFFFISYKSPHVFKIRTLVFQVIALTKRQQPTSFLDSAMDSIGIWVFFFYKGPLL
jgi:hypothetical protein